MAATLTPVVVLLAVLATDLWVYADARRCAEEGSLVVLRVGSFVVATPALWFAGCVVLWIIFFPAYLVSRFVK